MTELAKQGKARKVLAAAEELAVAVREGALMALQFQRVQIAMSCKCLML